MTQHGLIKITEDLHEAKICYLDRSKSGDRYVIRRDHRYNTWIVETYHGLNRTRLDNIADDLINVANKIVKDRQNIRAKMTLLGRVESEIGDDQRAGTRCTRIGRANSVDVLGFAPGNAPRLHKRIKPFCGTNDEIRRLRRGY